MQEVERRLYRYGDLIRRIKDTEEEIQEQAVRMAEMVESITQPMSFDNIRVQGGLSSDPVGNVVQKMIDVYDEKIGRLQDHLRDLIYEHDTFRYIIEDAELTEREMQYIDMRYIKRKSIEQMCDAFGYCDKQVKRIRKCVLDKLSLKIS